MHHDMRHSDRFEPNIAQHLLWDILETLTPPGEDNAAQEQTRNLAAAAMLEACSPANAYQAMVATHIIVQHHGAIGCYRWAIPTQSASRDASRLRRDGMAMTRTMIFAARERQRMQAELAAPARAASPQPWHPAPSAAPQPSDAAPQPSAAAPPPHSAPQPEAADAKAAADQPPELPPPRPW